MPSYLPLSFLTLLCLVGLVVSLFRRGLEGSLLHPYPTICLLYIICFGTPIMDDPLAMKVDLLHCAAFSAFSFSFFLVEGYLSEVSCRAWLTRLCSVKVLAKAPEFTALLAWMLTLASLAASGALFWAWSRAYGGLQIALFRFRSQSAIMSLDPLVEQLQPSIFSMAMITGLVLVYAGKSSRRLIPQFLGYVVLAAYLALAISTGTSGYLISLAVAYAVIDLLSCRRSNRQYTFSQLLVLMGSTAVAVMVLLSIRNRRFYSGDELQDYFLSMGSDVLTLSLDSTTHYRKELNYWVSYVVSVFDSTGEYLIGHTPWTVATHLIPRSIWPSKPLGLGAIITSGHLTDPGLALSVKHTWTVAVGLSGEGYANGGLLGILALSSAVGMLCGAASRIYQVAVSFGSLSGVAVGLAARSVAIGFVRGDVLSAWIAYVEPFVILVVLLLICRPFIHQRFAPVSLPARRASVA